MVTSRPGGVPDSQTNAGDMLICMQLVLGLKEATADTLAHGDLYPVGAPDGNITLSDDSQKLLPSRHEAGDGISMRSFLAGVRHTLRATASSDCGVWVLRRDDLQRLLANHPDFRDRLLGVASGNRLRVSP